MTRHGRPDYDATAGLQEIDPSEPVFVIRAKDRVAPQALAEYARLARLAGADPVLVQSVMAHAERMADWQALNGSKIPDLK